ncbi:MAG: hypothetical protein ABSH44_06105 [Bryobacteraceae bacterium]|jgi:hypothetical protein
MLKRFILWDFPRASWQYDVMVGIILAFIFLTPRDWFRDQPRIPNASSIAMLPSENGSLVFFVERELLAGIPEDQLKDKPTRDRLTEVLRTRTGNRHLTVTRVEPILNSEEELQGYLASARP